MKTFNLNSLLVACTVILSFSACESKSPVYTADKANGMVCFDLPQGRLTLTTLSENAVRVQCIPYNISFPQLEELIYTEDVRPVKPLVSKGKDKTGGCCIVQAGRKGMIVKIDTVTGALTFSDSNGNILLKEQPGGRSITSGETGGLPSIAVSQTFQTEKEEFLTGLGQFQDGYLNVHGLTRRLTQVNTQISIPMLMSNKGYGILWNNCGLTEFNPSESTIGLQPATATGQSIIVNATGTQGNVRERRSFNEFTGEMEIKEAGLYSILLDVGQAMARRHFLTIDDDTVFCVSNIWLPPTASALKHLSAGKHIIHVNGADGDRPSVGLHTVSRDSDRSDSVTTTFSSPVATALDYTVFAGNADQVISAYRNLTGRVPRMPEWAFGYIHCRERYDTQAELLENATRFYTDSIPVDVIVQDWQWWGKYGWNAMKFDEEKYPDPKSMTDSLHAMGMKLMLSVWSKIDRNCQAGRQMQANGHYIDGTDWIDFFNPEAAEAYWDMFSANLLPTGIDAWWQDATEPENDDLHGRMVAGGTIPGDFYRNAYPNMVNRTVYNGLRRDQPDRDPMILTRSGFTGIQRYGAVNWSGDVGNDFETLRRQITGGLSLMATGQPWWTYDAGGFFRPWDQYTDTAYHERMLRWLQVSVFLPFMRVHGYMSQTEPWHYPEAVSRIYVEQIKLRHSLMPYILECAQRVSEDNYTLMRPLFFDYPEDTEALKCTTQFMFGPDLMVCPITAAGVTQWQVYLPPSDKPWRDFYDGTEYQTADGGRYFTVPVTIERIPVFSKGYCLHDSIYH